LIVWAGIAGLTWGKNIKKKKKKIQDYLIIEARDRIGGRVDAFEQTYAVGPSFVHGTEENPMDALVKELGLSYQGYHGRDNYIMTDYDGSRFLTNVKNSEKKKVDYIYNQAVKYFESLKEEKTELDPGDENLTVGSAFYPYIENERFWEKDSPLERYLNFKVWVHEEYDGVSYNDKPLYGGTPEYNFYGGNHVIEGGYLALCNKLAKGLNILLNQVVTKIEYDDQKSTVYTSEGIFECKYLVLTVPMSIYHNNLIEFNPPLPKWKTDSMNKIKMGLMDKIAIRFPSSFWGDDLYRITYVSKEKGEYPWIDIYDDEPVLIVWTACEFAEKMEKQDDQTIINRILTILSQIFEDTNIPMPTDYKITRWRSDPFSGGSYCYGGMGSSANDIINAIRPINNIYFCGEGFSKYLGYTHGAYETACSQIKTIIQRIQNEVNSLD